MAWVIDTCLLIDVAVADSEFAKPSAALIDAHRPSGLAICPVSYVELAPVFAGDYKTQNQFLIDLNIRWPEAWADFDTLAAHKAWARYAAAKRLGTADKRPLADVLIGAFAERHEGLLTRNPKHFRSTFPALKIQTP